jgi:hypothetical protein
LQLLPQNPVQTNVNEWTGPPYINQDVLNFRNKKVSVEFFNERVIMNRNKKAKINQEKK